MTTINIHKDKLLPAAFAYQQRNLKAIGFLPKDRIEEDLSGLHGRFYPSHRSPLYLSKSSPLWVALELRVKEIIEEYTKLQTACRVAEDGIVSLDIDVVQRIFGEE